MRSVDDVASIFTFANQQVEFVVDGLFPVGTVCALTGGSGDGKTTAAIAIGSAIERGVPFAGMATQRRPVLFLDRENPLPAIVERYERMNIRDSENCRYWGGWCPEEPPDAASQMVAAWVLATEPKPVIFVDSFVAFHQGDENDAGAVRAHLQGYRRLADVGATIVILHHSGKSESTKDYRGSSDFKASLDVGYVIANIGDPLRLETVRLKAFKARFSVTPEIVLRFYGHEFISEEYTSPSQTNQEILRSILIENPRLTTTEFEKLVAAKSVPRHKARAFLKSGIASRHIDVESDGPSKFYTWLGNPESEP
ncbi:MAG TPA: AAA family ATPase, partial [Bryobacteraceae bacterium]